MNLCRARCEPAPQKRGTRRRLTRLLHLPNQALSSGCSLRLHLFHHLPHGRYMAGRAALHPGFIALRGFLQVPEEMLIRKPFPSLREDRLDPLKDSKKLAAGLKKEVFMK